MRWVQIASWHIVREGYTTLCGKKGRSPVMEEYPDGEKTCESCLRLKAKGQGQSSPVSMMRFTQTRAQEAI